MHGQPVAAVLDLDQPMGDAGGEERPVARAQLHRLTADLEHGGAGQEGDPLVLVLEVGLRGDVRATQDLLDDDVAEGENLFDPLAGGGDVGPRPQRASARGERNGLVGVVLAHDSAPATTGAPTAVIAGADAADKQDDEKDEKEQCQHE